MKKYEVLIWSRWKTFSIKTRTLFMAELLHKFFPSFIYDARTYKLLRKEKL